MSRAWRTKPPRWPALLPMLLLGLACAACTSGGGIGIGPISISKGAAVSGTTEPTVGLVAGAPILATATTPQLPAEQNGQALSPVAAYGNAVLVRATTPGNPGNPGTAASYALWDPATSALSPIPNWPAGSGAGERVVGVSGDWVVLTQNSTLSGPPASFNSAVSIILRNPKTGESRSIGTSGNGSAEARVAVADGWVAWVDGTPNHAGLHVYALATGVNHVVQARLRGINDLTLADGVVAWWQQGFGNQPSRVVVRNIGTGDSQSVMTGPIVALALSSDGQTLAWIRDASDGDPGLFLQDLATGDGGRLLGGQSVGVSLSASGNYIAWQPGSSSGSTTAGVYNVHTHELRLVQNAPGTSPRLARVIGPWVVWSDGATQAAAGQPGSAAASSFFLSLP